MKKEIWITKMMDVAEERISKSLPENYEVDDWSWCSDGFSIPVFDVSTIESSMKGAVDVFNFFVYSYETREETGERFNEELERFVEKW